MSAELPAVVERRVCAVPGQSGSVRRMQHLREWLLTLAGVLSLISVSASVVVAVREYRLKVRAEERQREASQAETDVKIAQLLADLLQIAEARALPVHSSAAVEQLFAHGLVPDTIARDPVSMREWLRDACTFNPMYGSGSQVAAIQSVGVLGGRYAVLERSARAGLTSLRDAGISVDQVDAALESLRAMASTKSERPAAAR